METPISSTTTGSVNTTVTTSTGLEQSTLKLVSNKTHIGPANKKRNKASSLVSAAANKIRINNDLKVTASDPAEESSNRKANSGSRALEIKTKHGSLEPHQAFTLMAAWGELFDDKPGTPDYIAKANRLNAVRSQVYRDLGFNPESKNRPELTEEQRAAYNEAVSPYSFDYYEVRLSFKQPGKKAVRSKTYRYLNAPDLEGIRSKLVKQSKVVSSEFQISPR